MLDRIGAGGAWRLLLEAQRAHAAEHRAKLAACLAVMDKAVPPGVQTGKGALDRLGRRCGDRAARYGDMAQSALLACLIDIELGGDPEAWRARWAGAAVALESHLAAARESADGGYTDAQIRRAREVFTRVFWLARADGD